MAQDKARAVSAFCSTGMDMQLRSKPCGRQAIPCSTRLPFPLFTIGVQNLGANGVWSCRSRLDHSAAGENPAEIPPRQDRGLEPVETAKTKTQAPNKFQI